MKDIESRYKRENNSYLIEIKLKDIRQLFNTFDPAPFREKDMDDDAEEYIVASVREFPLDTLLKLVIYLPENSREEAIPFIPDAICSYFNYRFNTSNEELSFILKRGRVSLLIGILFLFFCISTGAVIDRIGDGMLAQIIKEGLLISGWVAMWRPIQIFLYDWWPIRYMSKLYDKISKMPIEIRSL
ncbi:hypothetical protein KsCSTR_42460 [Candidatus Kuenenia stuttgartiensis]|uniref:Uncharacterized protein n=1 Tax=Kuenenia stuttgartiensis TaxID=174633 RepID=A0A6G7GVT6_KUEST|nr:hypothetical protein [Candidatus Kuenenia stuttgartiensis]QII13625.1 hypothetical protein KsCSTR_42460 [Candidatus Kuenenia stuttgartiensis]